MDYGARTLSWRVAKHKRLSLRQNAVGDDEARTRLLESELTRYLLVLGRGRFLGQTRPSKAGQSLSALPLISLDHRRDEAPEERR